MLERQRIPTAAPWAAMIGYSRAVRAGRDVHVSGTAPVGEDGSILHPRDPYNQARRCCEIILAALREAGAEAEHVVRTRIYLRHAEHWMDVGTAHDEAFGSARPATTMVVVAGFIDPAILVEIEADAVL
ncbi:MAG TPA: RidA family protein [Longimicrobiales bacterium]|nr:RidA family protein [Longimicrobiales bacterium]